MKKKRIISLGILTALILQSGSFNVAFADENEQKSLAVMQKLGIVSSQELDNAGQTINRAKFTYYAARALGLIDSKDKQYFKDLSIDHWANPHVSALVEMGVIDLAADGNFNPDASVTPEQAYKIMLVGLGYGKAGSMKEYITLAANMGMLVSTKNPDSLTLNESLEIIYNAMNIGAPRMIGIGEEFTQENLENNTYMSRHDLVEAEGTVTAVYGASLSDEIEVSRENVIYIDGEEYTVDNGVDMHDLLGKYVEFVYEEDDANSGNVIYAEEKRNEVIEISSDLIAKFNADTYELRYYKNSETTKTSALRIADGTKVIYNGKLYSGRISQIMNEFLSGKKHGKISIIENIKADADLMIINSYRTVVAKSYSEKDQVFFDYYSPANNLDLSETDVVRFINSDGTKAILPTSFMTVLDVAESEDGQNVEIIICDKQIKGNLNSVSSEENTEVEIGDTLYEMSDVAWNKFGQAIKMGTAVTAWVNSTGQVVYLETSKDSGMQAGYLMEARILDDDVTTKYTFKIFSGGTIERYPLADRVELDGNIYKMENYKEFFLNFPQVSEISEEKVSVDAQVIRFELNNNGEIAKIDTTNLGKNEIEDKSLKLVHDAGDGTSNGLVYVSGFKRFGMNYMYDSSYTDVFVLPAGVKDGKITINGNLVSVDDGMYSTDGSFSNLTTHYLDIYDYDADNSLSEIIVSEKTPMVSQMNIYMFKGTTTVIDSDEEVSLAMKCYGSDGEKTIIVDESLNGIVNSLKKGDVIIIDTDLQGKKAYNIEKYFDAEKLAFNDGENRNISNPYWYRGNYNVHGDSFVVTSRIKVRNVTKGYAYDVKNNVLEIMYEQDNNVSERVNAANIPVIIYDKNETKNEIYQGTLADVDTFKTTGNSDIVLTGYYSEAARCIFVYK